MNWGFDGSRCQECQGRCCKGESGDIWISQKELEELSVHLNVTVNQLIDGCIKRKNGKYSIKDIIHHDERVCFFFDTEKNNCSIYEYRPTQCRTFPFWENITKDYLERECPGIIL